MSAPQRAQAYKGARLVGKPRGDVHTELGPSCDVIDAGIREFGEVDVDRNRPLQIKAEREQPVWTRFAPMSA